MGRCVDERIAGKDRASYVRGYANIEGGKSSRRSTRTDVTFVSSHYRGLLKSEAVVLSS